MKLVSGIREHKYTISSLLFSILFLFPIMRNAVQSISLIVFLLISVLFYYKTFLVRVKDIRIWKNYGILTGFFWFSALTILWTSDKVFFLNEIRPSIAIAFIPFVILFFHPTFTQKSKQLAILFFLISLIIYAILWFLHHIEGISIYQEIIAKESPIRDESVIDQLLYLKSKSYKVWVGGISDRGYELLGKNSFFSHSNYISSYYVFGFVLSVYTLVKTKHTFNRVISMITIILSIVFLYYLSSKLNIVLFFISLFLLAFYFLKKKQQKLLFIGAILVLGIFNSTKIQHQFNELKKWDLFEKKDNNMDGKIFLDYKRTKIYSCVLKELKDNYVFGIGLGDIQGYLDDCLVAENQNNPNFDTTKEYNSHSQFLHFALVGGILNFLLFLGFFVFLFIKAFQKKNKLLLFFTLLISVSCFFENYLSRIYGVLYFILFIILLPNWEIIQNKTTKKAE